MSQTALAKIAVLGSIFAGLANPAFAEPQAAAKTVADFPACTDSTGETVRYVSSDDVSVSPVVMYAGTRYLTREPLSEPAIVYDPDFIAGLSAAARDFLMAHECYHLRSGDAIKTYQKYLKGERISAQEQEAIELAADCDAARRMRDEYHYSLDDITGIGQLIRFISTRREAQKRMENIIACFHAPFHTVPEPQKTN